MATPRGAYDLELLEADFLAVMQDKLPAKLTEINAFKNDAITLTAPANQDYYTDLSAQMVNPPAVFVHFGLGEVSPIDNGGMVAEEAKLFCIFLLSKKNNPEARIKVLRYTRAVKEVITEQFRRNRNVSGMKIMTIQPSDFTIEQNKGIYTAGGAVFETVIP